MGVERGWGWGWRWSVVSVGCRCTRGLSTLAALFAVRKGGFVVVVFLSAVVSALSLTRVQLSGTNCLFLCAILPLSALLNLPLKHFSF